MEWPEGDDPMEMVKRLSTTLMGPPLLVHSTSWRRGAGGVFLTFLVVIGEDQAPNLESVPITRADLARNSATEAAKSISATQAVQHPLSPRPWPAPAQPAAKAPLSPARPPPPPRPP